MTPTALFNRVAPATMLAATLAVASGAWTSIDYSATRASSYAAIVRLSSLALENAGDSPQIIVYATGDARVGIGNADPTPLTDTLRLSTLPSITADVTNGDVHVRLVTKGRMRVGAEVSGGRAIRFTATGRHIVILKGGAGADTITDP